MNERLAMALQQCAVDSGQRRYLRSIRHEPIPFRDRIQVAESLSRTQDHRLAALWYASALRYGGKSRALAAGYHLGNELRMARHTQAASRVLEEVCLAQPEWGEPAHSLAWLYRNAGQASKAADVMERWLDAFSPSNHEFKLVAGFLLDMAFVDRAERILAKISTPEPALQTERARLLQNLGRFGEAEKLLLTSLGRDPAQGDAWLRLAHARRWEPDEQSHLQSMEAAFRQPTINDSMRAAIAFALVKVYDDMGRYEQAWTYAQTANALRKRSARFARVAWVNYEKSIYQVFTKDFLEINSEKASERSPVFVVGMPRSGTTLLERRLGRHSLLQAVGELELIDNLALGLVGGRNYPQGLISLPPQAFAGAAKDWETRIPGGIQPGCEVVDKNPLNYMNLGFVFKLFPNARIIHCRRDPLDTTLSLWFQNFAHPANDYAYDMNDLAWMYGVYRRLMAWWEQVLPQPILTIDYETLVEHPEETLRGLISALGLNWEAQILESPGESEGAISTASLWQARQPLYKHASGRARNYEPWIAPLREALQREGIRT